MIYLDNAATTLQKPQQVIDAVVNAMTSLGNAARGAHENSLGAARIIYDTRCKIAALFGCERADHVIFTSNATEALNIALFGILSAQDHVIATELEHNSVLRPLYALERTGTEINFVKANGKGCVDYTDFAKLIKPNTKADAISFEKLCRNNGIAGRLLPVPRSITSDCCNFYR